MITGKLGESMLLDVCNGFLQRDIAIHLFDRLNKSGWHYGWAANVESDSAARHWHIELADSGLGSSKSCLNQLEARADFPELLQLWRDIQPRLPLHHMPTRVYANAHTYGVDGKLHRDCAKGAGEVTSLIYLNPVWKQGWGGETTFFTETMSGASVCVTPKPGRLVVFEGEIPHRVAAPDRECYDLRVTLIFKSRRITQ